mgnify:CR=1 FL=1
MKGQHVVQSLLLALTCVLGVVAVAAATEPKFELVNVSSTISETNAIFGAATAGDGRVVFAPFDAHGVGVFDPRDESFTQVSIASTVTANDGRVVFCPYTANGVGLFDPTDDNFTLFPKLAGSFDGAALARDGRVMFAPYRANGVGVFDPKNKAFAVVDFNTTISAVGDGKFRGAATASDGWVVFAPFNANGVGVFDPTDDGFTFVPIPYFGGQKFASARDCERWTGGICPI